MQEADRPAFERILRELFGALDKPLTEHQRNAFWKGLSRMSLTEFERCRDHILRELEDGEPPRRFGVDSIWAARRQLRASASQPIIERSSLEAEIASLTARDRPERAAELAASVRQCVASWESQRRENPLDTDWLLLDAYVARIDVEESASSPIRAERIAWARGVCERLLAQCGWDYVGADPRRVRVVNQLLGAAAMERAIQARPQEVAG